MEVLLNIAKEIIFAWKDGGKALKLTIVTAFFFTLIAILINLADWLGFVYHPEGTSVITKLLVSLVAVIVFLVVAYRRTLSEIKGEEKIERAEKKAQEHPDQTQAAWDLARIKLESYLNRNINQVRSIFWLTSLVMIVGFGFIGFGIIKAFETPETLTPALLSSISGLLINFIGATFLVIYKSTMQQAKEYVSILERINAVGMSVQVLEKLEGGNDDLRYKTTAELSKQLLVLYQPKV